MSLVDYADDEDEAPSSAATQPIIETARPSQTVKQSSNADEDDILKAFFKDVEATEQPTDSPVEMKAEMPLKEDPVPPTAKSTASATTAIKGSSQLSTATSTAAPTTESSIPPATAATAVSISEPASSALQTSTAGTAPTSGGTPTSTADWQTCYDEKQGAVYYWQPSTNSVVWQKPEGASVAPLASTSSSVKFTIGRDREAPAVQRGKAGMPVVNLRTQASDREKFAQEIAPSSILESDSDTASETSLDDQLDDRILSRMRAHAYVRQRAKSPPPTVTRWPLIKKRCEALNLKVPDLDPEVLAVLRTELRIADFERGWLLREHISTALDELVDELTLLESKKAPEGWVAVWEDSVGQYYYINKTTGETSWTYPGDAPAVASAAAGEAQKASKDTKPAKTAIIAHAPATEPAAAAPTVPAAASTKRKNAAFTSVTKLEEPAPKKDKKPTKTKSTDKKFSAMMAKWGTAKAELMQNEDELRKERDLQQWRAEQEEDEDNPNFAPLGSRR